MTPTPRVQTSFALPYEQYLRVQDCARELGISVSQFMRNAVEDKLIGLTEEPHDPEPVPVKKEQPEIDTSWLDAGDEEPYTYKVEEDHLEYEREEIEKRRNPGPPEEYLIQ